MTLALNAFAERWPDVAVKIPDTGVLPTDFGWVFSVETGQAEDEVPHSQGLPRLMLVHKESRQLIGTSQRYHPELFARPYKELLSRAV